MSDGIINHTYGAIFDGIDESNRGVQGLQQVKEQLVAGFAKLHSSGAFEGEAGHQLLLTQQRVGQRMDEHIATHSTISQRAVQQQHDTQALDHQGHNALSGL